MAPGAPNAGLARFRAAHLRDLVRRVRGRGVVVDLQLADQVAALCLGVEDEGRGNLAEGFHALAEQVAEWSWHWWRTLEPMLRGPSHTGATSSGDAPLQVDSIHVDASEVNELNHDPEEKRREKEALLV